MVVATRDNYGGEPRGWISAYGVSTLGWGRSHRLREALTEETFMRINMGIAVALGAGIGAGAGVALGNIALGVGFGVAVGAALVATAGCRRRS